MKQTYSKYTCTTSALSLFMFALSCKRRIAQQNASSKRGWVAVAATLTRTCAQSRGRRHFRRCATVVQQDVHM